MASKKSKRITPSKKQTLKTNKPYGVNIEHFLKSSNKKWWFIVGILLSLLILTFWRYLNFEYIYLFQDIGTDTINIFYPAYLQTLGHLQTEGIPMWSFSKGLGQSIYGADLFNSPWKWLFYLLEEDSLAYGIVYVEVFKILSIGILFFLYLRTVGLSQFTCLIGCLLMAFSGYTILGSTWHGHSKFVLVGVAFLLAFELLFKKNQWWLFPIAMIFLVGTKLYFVGIFLLIYSLFRFFDTKGWKPQKLLILYTKLGSLGFFGLAFTAPFIGATFYKFLYSPRVSGDVSYVDSLSNTPIFGLETSIHYLTVIMRFFSNDLLGDGVNYGGWRNYLEAPEFYCGLLTLLLIPQLFTFLNHRRKIVYTCFLGFWIFLIIFPYFRYAFYLFVGDYYKNALSFFIPVSFLFAGLVGLHYIHRKNKINLKVLGSTLIVLLILLNYPYATIKGIVDTQVQTFVSLMLVLHAGILYFWQNKTFHQHRYRLQWVLLIAVCFEVAYLANITVNHRNAVSSKKFEGKNLYNDYTKDAIQYLKSVDAGFYRVDKTYSCFTQIESPETVTIGSPNDAQALHYYGTPSYDSHNHNYYVRFLQEVGIIEKGNETNSRWIVGMIGHPFLESLFSIKYMLAKPEQEKFLNKAIFKRIKKIGDVQIYKNLLYVPIGVTYEKFMSFSNFQSLSNKNQKTTALILATVVEDDEIQKFNQLTPLAFEEASKVYQVSDLLNKLKADTLLITHRTENRFEGIINLSQPKVLFMSIPFDAGWSAKVNGKSAELELLNVGFTGLVLSAGNHIVELSYLPPFFYEGWAIFFIGLALYLYLVWRSYGRKIKIYFNGIR